MIYNCETWYGNVPTSAKWVAVVTLSICCGIYSVGTKMVMICDPVLAIWRRWAATCAIQWVAPFSCQICRPCLLTS